MENDYRYSWFHSLNKAFLGRHTEASSTVNGERFFNIKKRSLGENSYVQKLSLGTNFYLKNIFTVKILK